MQALHQWKMQDKPHKVNYDYYETIRSKARLVLPDHKVDYYSH